MALPRLSLLSLLVSAACAEPGAPSLIRGDDPLWDEDALSLMHLSIDAGEDWEAALLDAADGGADPCFAAEPLAAELEFKDPSTGDTLSFSSVGVELQGLDALAASAAKGERTGFRLRFDPTEGGLGGEEALVLAGTGGDRSLARSLLANRVARRLGLAAPRGGYTALWVNDKLQGVYPLAEERSSRAYLSSRFEDTSGPLFESTDSCGERSDLSYQGEAEADYSGQYEAVGDTSPRALLDGLVPLMACGEEADEDAARACVESMIDVDEWLTALALGLALPDVQGFATQSVGYSVYQDPADGRLRLIPASSGQAFQLWALPDPTEGLFTLDSPDFALHPPVFGARLQDLYPERYCERMSVVAAELDSAALADEVGELGAFLWDPVAADPQLDREEWRAEIIQIQASLAVRPPALREAARACRR